MRYLGGKARIANDVISTFENSLKIASAYIEPFVGGGHILSKVNHPDRRASDASRPLISMWKALQGGWIPPDVITQEEYEFAKQLPDSDPLKGFIGFGCSFAGIYFSGYGRNHKGQKVSTLAASTKRTLLKIVPTLLRVRFECSDYREICYPDGSVVYCDPPYANTTGYCGVGKFDINEFWQFFGELSRKNVAVFVSEYDAPSPWVCVKEIESSLNMGMKGKRIERIFVHT